MRGELERERVAAIQRERVLSAMVELTRERGAERVTVAHVVTRAGVSRRTFYELFTDREACFLAALEQALERIGAVVVPAYRGERTWCDRMRAGLTAMLELFDEQPALAALCVVDALGAGPRALERRAQVLGKLVEAVDRGRREVGAGEGVRAPSIGEGVQASRVGEAARPARASTAHGGASAASRIVAEGVVGAVLAILHARLCGDPPKRLLGLRGQLMSMIVLPYLGADAAGAERKLLTIRAHKARGAREDPLRGLNMRLTYRTMRVLSAIGAGGGLSNRHVARDAGVEDQGQISKLLRRLEGLQLIRNVSESGGRGERNAWVLTPRGAELERAIRARAEPGIV